MIWYLGLEPYRERYTELLTGWVRAEFRRLGVPLTVIDGVKLAGGLNRSSILEPEGRCHWALTQMANLVRMRDQIHRDDWIWIDDLFHPGYESLPYIYDQLPTRPRLAVRNHAQSVDPDDFTFPMIRWMRPFEQLVDQTADVTFCSATVHKKMMQAAGLTRSSIRVVGHGYSHEAVRALGPKRVKPWHDRDKIVVYASRFDKEKQPHFFLDMVEQRWEQYRFVVCTGAYELRSNDPSALTRARWMNQQGKLQIANGLDKTGYYRILADARVQLNTARQDFVSYTACEASSFETPTLAPAYRSFPEALENRQTQMFVPWSLDDAVNRLDILMLFGEPSCTRLAAYQDKTFERIAAVFDEPR